MTWLEDVVAAIEQSKQAYPNKEMPAEQQRFFVHMALRFCFTGSLNLNGVEHKDWSSVRRELSNAIRQDTAADWLAESCSSQQAADEEPEDSDAEFLEEFPKFLQMFSEFREGNLADFIEKVPVASPLKFHSVLSIIKESIYDKMAAKTFKSIAVFLEVRDLAKTRMVGLHFLQRIPWRVCVVTRERQRLRSATKLSMNTSIQRGWHMRHGLLQSIAQS